MRALTRNLTSPTGRYGDIGLLILRVCCGGMMAIAHGFAKLGALASFNANVGAMGFPLPWLTGTFAALSEAIGGLLIAIGLFTRPAAAALLTTMLTAALWVHRNDPFMKKELAVVYAVVAVTLLFTGPGRLSVDAALHRRGR